MIACSSLVQKDVCVDAFNSHCCIDCVNWYCSFPEHGGDIYSGASVALFIEVQVRLSESRFNATCVYILVEVPEEDNI